MKNLLSTSILVLFTCVTFNASATPLTNPKPTDLLEDLDGSGYFTPAVGILAIEVLDIFESFALPGSSFGFFFEGADVNNSANLFTIFSSTDVSNDQAVIDFTTGFVFDIEEATIESSFTGSGNIGFFLTLNALGGFNLFSDSSLNSGVDWFGAFPFIAAPENLALFFQGATPTDLLSLHVVSGLTSVPVPEPASAFLLLLGLIGFARTRKTVSA